MLHFEAIPEGTLGLLKGLQELPLLKDLRLVGGTALALQYGHRLSVDLDFFGKIDCKFEVLVHELSKVGQVEPLKNTSSIKVFSVDGVKVDIVDYPYSWIDNMVNEEGLILAGDKDIGAMKLSAITGRGTKKDFYDLYFLLIKYSLKDLLHFFQTKFPDGSLYLIFKSLIYFEDAELQDEPVMLQPVAWEAVKKKILMEHKAYMESL